MGKKKNRAKGRGFVVDKVRRKAGFQFLPGDLSATYLNRSV
jgi:hypothetical protein